MMRGIGILALIGLLVFGMYWFFQSKQEIRNYPSRGTDILAFGDSLIAGVGASDGNDLVSVLSKKIGEPIVNLGVSGDTTQRGIGRLEAVDEYKPRVVILLLGGNDALQRVSPDETFQNLRTIIADLQGRGAIVLLLGVRGGLVGSSFPERFERLSTETGAAFVPDVLQVLFGNTQYMSDAIHPNDAGYRMIAERVYPVLASLIRE